MEMTQRVPKIPKEERDILREFGFDVWKYRGSGIFGSVFSGVCNSFATKNYEINENRVQELSTRGGIVYTSSKIWYTKSLKNRSCAIKWIYPRSDKTTDLMKEAKTMIDLNHPNLIDIFNVLTCHESGNQYIITEFSNGGTLGQLKEKYLKDGLKLTEWEANSMMQQVVSGVNHLHSMGILHYDLHDGNIMIHLPDMSAPTIRQIKIIDFGCAEFDILLHPTEGKVGQFSTDIRNMGNIFLSIHVVTEMRERVKNNWSDIMGKMFDDKYSSIEELMRDFTPKLSEVMRKPDPKTLEFLLPIDIPFPTAPEGSDSKCLIS